MSIAEVADALEGATRNPTAGFHVDRGQEYLVRGLGRARTVEDLRAAELELALFMAYVKKPGYGPALLSVNRTTYDDSAPQKYYAQHGSTIWIDGQKANTQELDVEALYQEDVMAR